MRTGLGVFVLALCVFYVNCAPTIEYAQRRVNVNSQFVEEQIIYSIVNHENTPVTSVDLVYATTKLFFSAFSEYIEKNSEGRTPNKDKQLKVSNTKKETHNNVEYTIFTIELEKPLAKEESIKIVSGGIYGHVQVSLPQKITQEDIQLMILTGSHYIASVYQIETQTTEFNTNQIVGHSTEPPTKPTDDSILYGPYESLPAWSYSRFNAHFVNNAPFLTITNMKKIIEVSHWGANVAIEQNINIRNDGAELEGTFSRLDYMMGKRGNSVNEIVEYLPKGANSAYYRDVIGNISSSHIFPAGDKVKFELTPRFVLFGGWRTEYLMGYNLPAELYITQSGNNYKLALPFVTEIQDTIINEINFEVILPEGATNVQISSPYPIQDEQQITKKTYLDTTGRVVVQFNAYFILPGVHSKNLEITYEFSGSSLFFEPLYLIGGYFALFLLGIFFFRFNLEISTVTNDEVEIDPELIALSKSVQVEFEKVRKNYGNKKEFGPSVNALIKSLESVSSRFAGKGLNDTASTLKEVKKNVSKIQQRNKDADEQLFEESSKLLANL